MTNRRRKRHTPEQIVKKLRDADAMLTAGQATLVKQILQLVREFPRYGHRILSQRESDRASLEKLARWSYPEPQALNS